MMNRGRKFGEFLGLAKKSVVEVRTQLYSTPWPPTPPAGSTSLFRTSLKNQPRKKNRQ